LFKKLLLVILCISLIPEHYLGNDVINKLDIIVLDAGHGGKDPGAVGVSGVHEKNINLPITMKLGALIQSSFPDIKIIYTRTGDTFPELKDRTILANKNRAKLFISIHSNHKKTEEEEDKSGFEIYILNSARFPEAVNITSTENQVISELASFSDDTAKYIFSTLAHQSFLKYSYNLSYNFGIELTGISEIPSRGIRDADFWVLTGASMPSVLVECGYLSNERDENYLKTEEIQNRIAQALFEGFKRFKLYYEMLS
jgi:N-acetylmuramoyl-L-alanine amidase